MKDRITIILLAVLLVQIFTTNSLRAATNSNIKPDSTENGNSKNQNDNTYIWRNWCSFY
jgi:hypothetical protein